MTLDQQEPSANSPCTKTTFLVFNDVGALGNSIKHGKKRPQRWASQSQRP
jgi:hypothetical protein